MALRHVWRCLSYLSLVVIAGLFITGCVIREPRAITEIGLARKALDDARRAGKADCAPDPIRRAGKTLFAGTWGVLRL